MCTDISFFFTELHLLPSRRNHEDGLQSLRHGRLSCGRSCGSAVSLRCCGSPLALASSANDATTDRRRFPLISQTTAQQHNIPNLPLKYIRLHSGRTQGFLSYRRNVQKAYGLYARCKVPRENRTTLCCILCKRCFLSACERSTTVRRVYICNVLCVYRT